MPAKEVHEVDWNNQDPTTVIYKIGIYGWRKRCIYFLILLIMILTIINLSLVIWVMRVMDFNFDGMGKLRITDQGLKLYGDAEFVEALHAKLIRSRQNSELILQSTANVTVNARSEEGNITGQLVVGNDEIVARNKKFSIVTDDGKTILYADKDNITFVAEKLQFKSPSGAQFSGSVETEVVRAPPYKDLKLASLTRSLFVEAPNDISFHSKAGSMNINSLNDVKIKSMSGKVLLDAETISFNKLDEGTQAAGSPDPDVREVCSCKDGKLFLAPADSKCLVSKICDS